MELLNRIILNNTVAELLLALLIIASVALTRKWISRHVAALLYHFIQRKWKSVEKNVFIGLIIKPLGSFLTLLIALVSIANLNFPEAWKIKIYKFSLDGLLHVAGKSLAIIYLIWVCTSFIDFIALVLEANAQSTKDKRDDQLIVFFRDFVKAIIIVIGLLMILKIGFGVDIGALLTGLSIVGAALALAAKESIENLIASFIIFFDKPFFTGDHVKVNTYSGKVEHIGLRSTRIRTPDQTLVSVPNKQMVDSVVDNLSMRTARRAEIKIELEKNNDTQKIEVLMAELKACLASHYPSITSHTVFLTDFTKNSAIITIEYFTQPFSMDTFHSLKQEVNFNIKKLTEEKDIKMANAGNDINIYNVDTNNNTSINSQIV